MAMIAPPGTAVMLEPGGLDALPLVTAPEEPSVVSASSHQLPAQQADNTAADCPDGQNRVIVRRRPLASILSRKDAVAPGDGREEQRQKANVRPSYSSLRSNIIRRTPETMKCKLYCRGPKCVYCNAENWSDEQQAIRGIYSSWICDDILAMARPTTRTFDEFDLVTQFKGAGVRTVLNLQCVNEHEFCGPPLVAHSGFSYDPEVLMREKFYYFNFAIPDFGTAAPRSILDIVKVVWFALRHGRVAVHCHAGLGRTGTLVACFLIWSRGMLSGDAIEAVRNARPNSIQSMEQINAVEDFAHYMHKFGTTLPSTFYTAQQGVSLRQLMANQRQFLPNEEARRFTHIPKLLYMLSDRLLRQVFEQDGIHYSPPNGHHARSCTLGTICVNWRNAFTPQGKSQVRQVVNLFARITAFPYEKDQALIARFQQLSLVNAEAPLMEMETPQLVALLNALMESIKRPYCSRKSLIDALGHFSPDNPTVMPEEDEDDDGGGAHYARHNTEEAELVKILMNPGGEDAMGEAHELNNVAAPTPDAPAQAGTSTQLPMAADEGGAKEEGHSDNDERKEGPEEELGVEKVEFEEKPVKALNLTAEAGKVAALLEERRPSTLESNSSSMAAAAVVVFSEGEMIAFDSHDSHTNKEVSLSADWQCSVFYVCNVLSYLTGENYDTVVDLLTFWFTGDSNRDVKQAVYCHMRDLFARNMRQQEQQAAEWRRRMGLPEKLPQPRGRR